MTALRPVPDRASDVDWLVVADALDHLWHTAPTRRDEIGRVAARIGITLPAPAEVVDVDDVVELVPA